ncbi:MAG: hypothetical protein IJ873_04885, partial [Lachnospiraceae bacterium]|nr:hypothetical protein [Lachnospiraceae bacterium]
MDGVLNIYKEQGYTSHDVVAKLRGILKQKRIGHTGTLDPMAEGVLPVCIGNATRLCDMFTDVGKEYEAVENGTIGFTGAKPINPSGGLIGAGHPVGGSGARMLL